MVLNDAEKFFISFFYYIVFFIWKIYNEREEMKKMKRDRKKSALLEDELKVIACELKCRRVRSGLTLMELADDTCSSSYISKIENMQLRPNLEFLEELFSKLEISSSELDGLIGLDEKVVSLLEAYFDGDYQTIEDIYKETKNYLNYRRDIIELVYYVYKQQYSAAGEMLNKIAPLAKNMPKYDFSVFCLFKGIVNQKHDHMQKAAIILKALKLNDNEYEGDILNAIRQTSLLEIAFEVNSINYEKYRRNAIDSLIKVGREGMINEILIKDFLYALKNNSNEEWLNRLHLLESRIDYKDYLFLYNLKTGKPEDSDDTDFRGTFIRALGNTINHISFDLNDSMFDNLSLKERLVLEELNKEGIEKIKYIEEACFPFSCEANDVYLAKYFGKKLIDYYCGQAVYKKALAVSQDIIKAMDIANEI